DISEKYPEISDEIIWETSDTPSNEWLEVQHDEPIAQIMGSYPAIYVGGRINGRLIAVGRASNFEKWTTLSRLFVSEDFRGRGIGRTCMERLLNNAREKGASKALLQVDSKNAHAITLYENLGFRFHHSYRYRALSHSEKNQPC
ncbi:MAG: GNAT family N-acetyltransferase, partial [Actinobacteria bacterium]|nr:GNAT family N-acetyltransferase [Actinomycetota bacterium]